VLKPICAIYGFGSFFVTPEKANDIDILILHQDISIHSIRFAIMCKARLAELLPSAHVIMLSNSEERKLALLKQTKAKYLGEISEATFTENLIQTCNNILNR
jgi:hypothetical protein